MSTTPARVTRHIHATPEAVWAVLSDGWTYASWVVGTARIRAVDHAWPAEHSHIHHSFGLWPVLISDSTEVLRSDPGRELLLRARGWPAGAAEIRVTLEGQPGGACTVVMEEDVVAGPAALIPAPLRQLVTIPRNTEALRRLAFLAEGTHA
jgi:uncharacterized protein YndB with AHSA1/START domain